MTRYVIRVGETSGRGLYYARRAGYGWLVTGVQRCAGRFGRAEAVEITEAAAHPCRVVRLVRK